MIAKQASKQLSDFHWNDPEPANEKVFRDFGDFTRKLCKL
jgi:hypothetical protein